MVTLYAIQTSAVRQKAALRTGTKLAVEMLLLDWQLVLFVAFCWWEKLVAHLKLVGI